MKKILILLVVLPVVCLSIGYGAGMYLSKPSLGPENEAHSTEKHETDHTAAAKSDDSDLHAGEARSGGAKPIVVKLGQMIVPVYKARSVTYVVMTLGVTVPNLAAAEYYNLGENASKLRDSIFVSLKISAEGRALRGVTIDTEKLSHDIMAEIKPKFSEINDVLFLAFYKKDVARS